MKTGTSMSSIIDTKKAKKFRKTTNCNNCKGCVNLTREGCRFGWEPIKGKCNRFGTNHYKLNKEEVELAKKLTAINKEKIKKEQLAKEEIHLTSIKKLEDSLDTKLTYDKIKNTTKKKIYGNGRFTFRCVDHTEDYLIIRVTFKDKTIRKYKIIK